MKPIPRGIEDLADELVLVILKFLPGADPLSNTSSPVNPPGRSPGLDDRPPHVRSESTELDRFRLVCKRFARISTPEKFARFNLRFGNKGFQRLGELLHMQLACHVKYFTYMARPFYQGSGNCLSNKQSLLRLCSRTRSRLILQYRLAAISQRRRSENVPEE
jgi:hypothetical protein